VSTSPSKPAPYRERFFRSEDDLKLYWRDYGDPAAPELPFLCLPGLTRNSKDFAGFGAHFGTSRRVICPDYRGRGRSQYDRDWRNYRPELLLNDIRHLLAAAGIERAIVVGTSMGGVLAMALGAFLPTALAAVILNDVGPEFGGAGLDRIFDYISTDHPHADWPSAIAELKIMFPKLALEGDADWLAMADATFRRGSDGKLHFDWDTSLAKAIDRANLPDLWPYFRSLRDVPTLALRGGVSDVLTEECFERMAREHPRLMRVTVPGVGHTPSLGEPAARAALASFLDDL
jgi:pimeloyl-ACP methyl ester carboxylesterase